MTWQGLAHAWSTDPEGVKAILRVADSLSRHPDRDTMSPSLRVELASIIENESRWNPAIKNSINCVGLIQFCPGTARTLGYSPAEIASLSRTEQARLVAEYYSRLKPPRVPGDLYLLTFLPAYAGDPPGTVIACEGVQTPVKGARLSQHVVWRDNPGLRGPGGCITVDSVRWAALHRSKTPPPIDLDDIDPYPPPSPPSATGPVTLAVALAVILILLSKRGTLP